MTNPMLVTELRPRLLVMEAELRDAISRETRELSTSAAERGDDTTPSFSDLGQEVVHREEVRAALARMVDGGYGVCVDCRRPIAVARLIARPQASRDVACGRRVDGRGR